MKRCEVSESMGALSEALTVVRPEARFSTTVPVGAYFREFLYLLPSRVNVDFLKGNKKKRNTT